nr:Na/Pi cotransporter family protein [Butyrivibrio sp.]
MTSIELFTLIAGLVGGLAMFLYGMNIMSGGLTKASGGKLESTLSAITSNKILAYLFGVGVTALVQSSSASTVMVVGLVNSGIMSLKEAVNVILGANLGTTFTAWLLSLNAISSDNFLINLLKPASFTPFLALIGIVLFMFTKSDKKRNVGVILLGFSVLMFGMDMMSDAVSPLKDVPAFQEFLLTFKNPVIGLLVGVLFTMMIQSSAGTIGVVQALSLSVSITYSMAIPVVIGAEVGTCITAILSSFGANKNGKRTALMHLYFNIIKAGTFMIVFYTAHSILDFGFMDDQAGMVGIASIHTLVNLVGTPLMLPFSDILVKLALRTIPIDQKELEQQEQERGIAALDPRFLSNPPFALEQSKLAANDMAVYSKDSLFKAMSLLDNYSEEVAAEVASLEQKIDRYEDQLGTYLIKINSNQLTKAESHTLSTILHSISDFERISDHALNIMQVYQEMHLKNQEFSPKAKDEITIFGHAIEEIVTTTVDSFETMDIKLAKTVEPLEEVIDGIHMEVKRRHVRRLRKGKCTIDLGFILSDLGTDFERIADHCSNIAVSLIQVNDDTFDAHEYIEMLKEEKNTSFEQAVDFYERKYRLPVSKSDEEAISPTFASEHPVLVNVKAFEDSYYADESESNSSSDITEDDIKDLVNT